MTLAINFFTERINFKLKQKRIIKGWINYIANSEGKKVGELSFVFSSDEYLLKINKQYLNHDTYTDIVTFPYNEFDIIKGDIFISIDRVKFNAPLYSNSFQSELYRVIVHGILHLVGYSDKDSKLQNIMRSKEDYYLQVLYSQFLLKA